MTKTLKLTRTALQHLEGCYATINAYPQSNTISLDVTVPVQFDTVKLHAKIVSLVKK